MSFILLCFKIFIFIIWYNHPSSGPGIFYRTYYTTFIFIMKSIQVWKWLPPFPLFLPYFYTFLINSFDCFNQFEIQTHWCYYFDDYIFTWIKSGLNDRCFISWRTILNDDSSRLEMGWSWRAFKMIIDQWSSLLERGNNLWMIRHLAFTTYFLFFFFFIELSLIFDSA